jgi:hypothetical protein
LKYSLYPALGTALFGIVNENCPCDWYAVPRFVLPPLGDMRSTRYEFSLLFVPAAHEVVYVCPAISVEFSDGNDIWNDVSAAVVPLVAAVVFVVC